VSSRYSIASPGQEGICQQTAENRTSCWKDHRHSRVIGKERAEASWAKKRNYPCVLVWGNVALTNPSKSPSPVVAQLGTTYHILSFNCVNLSFSVTSVGVIAPGISCLFANTKSNASFISRSRIMRCSSFLASSIRARSLESMTNIRPWVPEK
jgi:hypothetical protein